MSYANGIGVLHQCGCTLMPPSHHIQYHVKQVGAQWGLGGGVPSGLERSTGDQVVLGSNPAVTTSLRNVDNSVYPALHVYFGEDTKSRRSLLSGIYDRGSKRSNQSALEMCRGLHHTPLRDNRSSWTSLEICLTPFVCYHVSENSSRRVRWRKAKTRDATKTIHRQHQTVDTINDITVRTGCRRSQPLETSRQSSDGGRRSYVICRKEEWCVPNKIK